MIKTLLFSLLLLGQACGPTYQTSYSYSPPGDIAGNSCTNQCQSNQQDCEWNERRLQQDCEYRSSQDYNFCEANKRHEYNYKKKRTECVANCYCSKNSCPAANLQLCTERYNTCFVGCGGTVVVTTQCTSNCEKANPPTTEILRGSRDN